MAFVGNLKGPRESEIMQRLGHSYFGITPRQLADDIACYEDSERRGEVQPVYLDEVGRPYIVLSRKSGPDRFYLLEYGYELGEELVTRTEQNVV